MNKGDKGKIARMHTFRKLQHSMVQVDLGAIEHNCMRIMENIGEDCQLCAVVKADGYGLGATKIAHTLEQFAGLLAVYSPDEAGELLVTGVSTPVLILSPVYGMDRYHPVYAGLATKKVQLVVHGVEHLESIISLAKRIRTPIQVQVKIDTGLHRGGCSIAECTPLVHTIVDHPLLELTGIMTHFISAVHDEALTREQHNRFANALHSLKKPLPANCLVHEANTAAMVQWNWTHLNMVRVGLAWTGVVPNGIAPLANMRPVVTWRTRVAHVKQVKSGEHVGYSGKWTAKRPSRIGIVPVGYSSGYPMGVGAEGDTKGAYVRVYDESFTTALGDAPVLGSVCMDQIAIDITDIASNQVTYGIELLTAEPSSNATLQRVAEVAGVVPHAIISRISSKVHRTYVEGPCEVVTPLHGQSVHII